VISSPRLSGRGALGTGETLVLEGPSPGFGYGIPFVNAGFSAATKCRMANTMSTFLLGAGFNVDARGELGPIIGESIYIGKYEIETGYPLISHLWPICFGVDGPAGASFEQRLAESLDAGDYGPTDAMLDAISKADFYIASRHAKSGPGESRYKEFLRANPGVTFLTFNYDSLLEIILLNLERWSPHSGFGIPVVAIAEGGETPPVPSEEDATN